MAEKILMPIEQLDPDLIADLTQATEDVPLIEDGHVTEAGEVYILSEAEHDRIEADPEDMPTLHMRAVENVRYYQTTREKVERIIESATAPTDPRFRLVIDGEPSQHFAFLTPAQVEHLAPVLREEGREVEAIPHE
jgi:hypothetical protein